MESNSSLRDWNLFNSASLELPMPAPLPPHYLQNSPSAQEAQKVVHCQVYQYLVNCNMKRTAASFLDESKPAYPSNDLLSMPPIESFGPSTSVPVTAPMSPIPKHPDLKTELVDMSGARSSDNDIKNSRILYACRYPGCKGSFTTPANMKRHEKLHSGEKPYCCDQDNCGKRFARKYDLKLHCRTHTKEKPYSCKIDGCKKRFGRLSSLKEHERNLHNVFTSSPEMVEPKKESDSFEFSSKPQMLDMEQRMMVPSSHTDYSSQSTSIWNQILSLESIPPAHHELVPQFI